MSSTVASRVIVVASAVIAFGWTSQAFAASSNAEAALVARLYKDFAWQAFASQSDLFGDDLAHQNKATLDRYFAPALTALLLQDSACEARHKGVCNLDFDLLFDSQDPQVTDLDVETVAPGKVSVVFKNPVNDQKTRIDFKLVPVAGNWKITDIVYTEKGQLSLKSMLSRRIP